MNESEEYRSKLRTPNKRKLDIASWGNSSPLAEFGEFSNFLNTPSPVKRQQYCTPDLQSGFSPHKSGYLLRTPSPHKSSGYSSPIRSNIKRECKGTPSPHKAASGADLFGNRSLLDNLPIPDWDDNFLDNFQEGLFGLGSEDLEGLIRSPAKSPRRNQPFLTNSPFKKSSPNVSPFKNPLLTSSPKLPEDSPSGSLVKTPGVVGGRPLTRQRKLFLLSPERHVPSTSTINWPTPLPFSSFDDTTSSMLSDMGNETTASTQSISTYMKQIDCEANDDYPVLPPVGWTVPGHSASVMSSEKLNHKGKGKSLKHKQSSNTGHNTSSSSAGSINTSGSKKVKPEPQFTLLRPHAEIHNSQICLRMAPRTPPNKIKISRDFSQIQTLPSKERLRIVRNRFRETLNRAVELVIEKEKKLKEQNVCEPPTQSAPLNKPMRTIQPAPPCTAAPKPMRTIQPAILPNLFPNFNVHGLGYPAKTQILKKKKR
uniref:Uncharacterized protein n=1 Tax=Biomphalaria glabrata TaxID=6526 RepID=A0A2C9LI82_BIOGL